MDLNPTDDHKKLIAIAGLIRIRVLGVVTAAYLDLGITWRGRFLATEGAVPDVAVRAFVVRIRGWGFVGIGLLTGTARVLARVFVALETVAGIAVNAKHARRVAAGVDVDVAGRGISEHVLAAIGADRSRRFDPRLTDRFLQLVFVRDDLADGGFTAAGLRRYAFAGLPVICSIRVQAGITRTINSY